MIDSEKSIDTGPEENSVPGMLKSMASDKMDLTKYKVRVQRFEIGPAESDALFTLENLYTKGLDGSNDIVIMKEKTFTDQDTMVIVIWYLERKVENDPATVLKNLQKAEEE